MVGCCFVVFVVVGIFIMTMVEIAATTTKTTENISTNVSFVIRMIVGCCFDVCFVPVIFNILFSNVVLVFSSANNDDGCNG